MKLTRRHLLMSSAAIPFSAWVKTAQGANQVFTRFDARSAKGKAMLQTYADAVKKMKATAEGSPVGWLFQWYTHAVPTNTTKTAEIARVYPTPSTQKDLAAEMWETCEAHFSDDEDLFLPWHRMFVYRFERIIRKVSGNAEFTLPYWNYTVNGPDYAVIPEEFRKTGSSLLQGNRNPGVNTGQPIDQGRVKRLNLDAMKQTEYQASPDGTKPGFCSMLDGTLHGNVHVFTGGQQNMGQVPWAARDPVFWAHHCMIDRIWASWNKIGGRNPTDRAYLSRKFVFADEEGRRVEGKVGDVLDMAKLGYTYDSFEPKPPGFVVPRQGTTLTSAAEAVGLRSGSNIALGAGEVTVGLETVAAEAPGPLTTRLASAGATKRWYLVARDFKAAASPGVVYDVFLNRPAGASGEEADKYQVGTINFFDATSHGDHRGMSHSKSWSVDVTDLVKRLSTGGAMGNVPRVTIAPVGRPADGAAAVIGLMRLVEK